MNLFAPFRKQKPPPPRTSSRNAKSAYLNDADIYDRNVLNSFSFGAASAGPATATAPPTPAPDDQDNHDDGDNDNHDDDRPYHSRHHNPDTTPRPSLVPPSRSHQSQHDLTEFDDDENDGRHPLPPPRRLRRADTNSSSDYNSDDDFIDDDDHDPDAVADADSSANYDSDRGTFFAFTDPSRDSVAGIHHDSAALSNPLAGLPSSSSSANRRGSLAMPIPGAASAHHHHTPTHQHQLMQQQHASFEARVREARRPSKSLDDLHSFTLTRSNADAGAASGSTYDSTQPFAPHHHGPYDPHQAIAPTSVPQSEGDWREIRERSMQRDREISPLTVLPGGPSATNLSLPPFASGSSSSAAGPSTSFGPVPENYNSDASSPIVMDEEWLNIAQNGVVGADFLEMTDVVSDNAIVHWGHTFNMLDWRRNSTNSTSTRRQSTISDDIIHRRIDGWLSKKQKIQRARWVFGKEKDPSQNYSPSSPITRDSAQQGSPLASSNSIAPPRRSHAMERPSISLSLFSSGPRASAADTSNLLNVEKSKDKGKNKEPWRGIPVDGEEMWFNATLGRFKVIRKNSPTVDPLKPHQQRLQITYIRNPELTHPTTREVLDGPTITIHKHSKAGAFSISRHYRQRLQLGNETGTGTISKSTSGNGRSVRHGNAGGATQAGSKDSIDGTKKRSDMILLATRRVQRAYTSTNTTRRLEHHGLLDDGRGTSRSGRDRDRGADDRRREREKEKEREKRRSKSRDRKERERLREKERREKEQRERQKAREDKEDEWEMQMRRTAANSSFAQPHSTTSSSTSNPAHTAPTQMHHHLQHPPGPANGLFDSPEGSSSGSVGNAMSSGESTTNVDPMSAATTPDHSETTGSVGSIVSYDPSVLSHDTIGSDRTARATHAPTTVSSATASSTTLAGGPLSITSSPVPSSSAAPVPSSSSAPMSSITSRRRDTADDSLDDDDYGDEYDEYDDERDGGSSNTSPHGSRRPRRRHITPHQEAYHVLPPEAIERAQQDQSSHGLLSWKNRFAKAALGTGSSSFIHGSSSSSGKAGVLTASAMDLHRPNDAYLKTPYKPPWPVTAPRHNTDAKKVIVDDLNTSFQDVGLLPAMNEIKSGSGHHKKASRKEPRPDRERDRDREHRDRERDERERDRRQRDPRARERTQHREGTERGTTSGRGASPSRRRDGDRDNEEPTPDIFDAVPPDALYMILPLWPGETDSTSSKKYPYTPSVLPASARQYLLLWYKSEPRPREPDRPSGGTGSGAPAAGPSSAAGAGSQSGHHPSNSGGKSAGKSGEKKRSKGSPTSSHDSLKKEDRGVLMSHFHITARVVSYPELQGSGVKIPDVGLAVTGPLEEAYQSMPVPASSLTSLTPSTSGGGNATHTTPSPNPGSSSPPIITEVTNYVIGACTYHDKGVEFFPEGFEKMGLAKQIPNPTPYAESTIDGEDDDARSLDTISMLSPLGRAVMEMAWLGMMAVTSFNPNGN